MDHAPKFLHCESSSTSPSWISNETKKGTWMKYRADEI